MKVLVEILDKQRALDSREFGVGVYRFGRSDFSDLILPDPTIGRSQLEMRVSESAVYVTNMGRAGTLRVNNIPMETAQVSHGDALQVGPYRIIVRIDMNGIVASRVPAEGEPSPSNSEKLGPLISDREENGENEKKPQTSLNPVAHQGGAKTGAVLEAAELFSKVSMRQQPEAREKVSRGVSQSDQNVGLALAPKLETVVDAKPTVARLIFTDGPKKGQEIPLQAFEMTLGRSRKADICIEDKKLSRIHCKIVRTGVGYRLVDCNSRNGTYVNGVRVLEHPLSSFDVIALGKNKITFLIQDAHLPPLGMLKPQVGTQALIVPGTASGQARKTFVPPPVPVADSQSPSLLAWKNRVRALRETGRKRVGVFWAVPRNRALVYGVAALIVVMLLIPSKKTGPPRGNEVALTPKMAESGTPVRGGRDWHDLNVDTQRSIEGHYATALHLSDQGDYAKALEELGAIHQLIPFYKDSRALMDEWNKRLKDKEVDAAKVHANQQDAEDVQAYIQEGKEFLKQGDFDRAGESFNAAIVLDPNNGDAIAGLKAADLKIRDISQVPMETDPVTQKKAQVAELFKKAIADFTSKHYQSAIDTAEKIRGIELPGDPQYLSEAKQIIDRARMLQREEFEPFLLQAKEKFAEGDYVSSRNLCEEMTKQDPDYAEAKDCLLKSKKQLNRLAKEAYTHGYILESMNRIDDAKKFWERAEKYVEKGDAYYDKVHKKLDLYQ